MTARDLLYKYFGQLELLELRFSEIKVTFPWFVIPLLHLDSSGLSPSLPKVRRIYWEAYYTDISCI